MRSVSARLGVSPVPLYSRVGNKDALVDAIADRLLADLAPPHTEGEPWGDYAARWARELRTGSVGRATAGSSWPRPRRVRRGVPAAGRRHARKRVRARRRRAGVPSADLGDGRVRGGRERRAGTAVRPTRRIRPGGDPGGVDPAEADAFFDLHIRYVIEGIARDAEGGDR